MTFTFTTCRQRHRKGFRVPGISCSGIEYFAKSDKNSLGSYSNRKLSIFLSFGHLQLLIRPRISVNASKCQRVKASKECFKSNALRNVRCFRDAKQKFHLRKKIKSKKKNENKQNNINRPFHCIVKT